MWFNLLLLLRYNILITVPSQKFDFFFRTLNDFLYIGGQLNVENLAGNQFVNFAVLAFTELPSVFVGEFLINRYGR